MWDTLKAMDKFTPKAKVDRKIGKPKFQLDTLPTFYYGEGFLIGYSSIQYRIEKSERIEYGKRGEYANAIYHFSDVKALKTEFGIKEISIVDDINFEGLIHDGIIGYHSTFKDVHQWFQKTKPNVYYQEFETYQLVNGEIQLTNLTIRCGQFDFFFYECAKNSKLSGFKYTLSEKQPSTLQTLFKRMF